MRVVFVQKFVPHYRLPFFSLVRQELASRGIEFVLVYGQPDPYEGSKVKMEYPVWGNRVKNHIVKLAGKYIYWQRATRFVQKGDLVVAEHAAKLLDNYVFYLWCQIGYVQFSYFGHGENFQKTHELPLSSWLKKLMIRRVSHWFAYTEISRQSLIRQSVEVGRITVVNNTLKTPVVPVDTQNKNPNKYLYIGGLYADKKLEWILEAGQRLADVIVEFELHIVGDGPLRSLIEDAEAAYPWLHYHGSLYGEERDRILGESAAILMPGLVGLVAIDSFHFQCPIITSAAGQHSPEVAYLEHDYNSIVDDIGTGVDSFTNAILRFHGNRDLVQTLYNGCRESAREYTLENMVQRFCNGAESCLKQSL